MFSSTKERILIQNWYTGSFPVCSFRRIEFGVLKVQNLSRDKSSNIFQRIAIVEGQLQHASSQ
jgi:hypothetical protein